MKKHTSILESIHETAKDLHASGVMNDRTMREFDVLCLPPVKDLSAAQIKRIRQKNGMVHKQAILVDADGERPSHHSIN